MAAEELVVDLVKRNDSSGLGFSLLGISGLPHIVYDIVENSPAAESGEVKASISSKKSFISHLFMFPVDPLLCGSDMVSYRCR